MAKNRYYKTTIGQNTEVLVAGEEAYTAEATFEDFVDNAVSGEIGVFDAETKDLVAGALGEGDRFFVAQKRDEGIFKTTPSVYQKKGTKKIAYTAPVKQVSTITVGTYTPDIHDELSISIIETTPGNQPFPRWTYAVEAKAGETAANLVTRLADKINDVNDLAHADMGVVVEAVAAGSVLTVTAAYFGSSFRVALSEKAYEVASVVYTTPFKLGSGFYEHVAGLEEAGNIFDGVTTNYPVQNATAAEFGEPTKFATSGVEYDIYQLDYMRDAWTPIPQGQQHHKHHIAIAVPTGAGGPGGALDTALGF